MLPRLIRIRVLARVGAQSRGTRGADAGSHHRRIVFEAPMAELRRFFRANPQVLVLLIICLVLGIGTFLAVVFGLISAGNATTNGEPSGLILLLRAGL